MAIEGVNNIAKSDLDELHLFLEDWDKRYFEEIKKIPLFDKNLTRKWNKEQKQLFVKLLYHQRAHFDDILWFMGNFAPDQESKQMIIDNISDEFGMKGVSHEKLYLDFAKSMDVDLTYELLDEKYYYSFLREYNQGHLRWLRDNDWD